MKSSLNILVAFCIFFPLIYYAVAYLLSYCFNMNDKYPFWDGACSQGASIVGIPFSCAASLLIIQAFNAENAQIKPAGDLTVKALSLEFSGQSGPVVLWVLCFLAFIIAISVLQYRPKDSSKK